MLELKLVFLLVVANGAPLILKRVLGERWSRPLDGGHVFCDGKPLFGKSKTVRGVVVAVLMCGLAAWLLDVGTTTGLVVGTLAMVGDLISSFLKRRLGWAPGKRALGLDQIPEAALPLIACHWVVGLEWVPAFWVLCAFTGVEFVLSRADYYFGYGDHPY